MRVYYDRDADVDLIKDKKVVVVGYGSQGHAHAANLRDSGVKDVRDRAASRLGHGGQGRSRRALRSWTPAEAAKWADIVMILTPDELQADLYRNDLKRQSEAGRRAGLRARPQHPFQADRAARRSRRVHDRAEGPRPYRALANISAAAACPAWSRSTRTPRAMRWTSRCPMPRPSAAAGPASSRPISARNARPTCSASRRCCAAA